MEERAVGAVGVEVWEEVRERKGEDVYVNVCGRRVGYISLIFVSLTRRLQCSGTGHSSDSCNI